MLERGSDPLGWLGQTFGQVAYATTPHQTSLGDAVEVHFRSLQDAQCLLERFPKMILADDTMGPCYTSPAAPFGRKEVEEVCNLYTMTRAQDAMRQLFNPLSYIDRLGNLPSPAEIYPDYPAPILRSAADGLEMAMARWGLPTPPQFLIGKKTDRGVTNVRNTASPHWRRWLGPEHRCLVPLTAFAEPDHGPGGNVWFRLADDRPAFFAGIHVPRWTSVRKLRDGETTDDLFAFLTTAPNAMVAAVHPKAMPVILTEPAEWEQWLFAPWAEVKGMQRPLPDGVLARVDAAA